MGEWKHDRRSIEHYAPQHWVGWDRILELYENAVQLDIDYPMKDDRKIPRKSYALYFVTLFQTGGRINEVLQLRPDQIDWNEEVIKIENMTVLKRRKRFTRNVFIKIEGNPLAYPFIKHIEECDTRYLLPGYGTKSGRRIDPNSAISSTYVYKKICEIDPDIWPHWLRDQRSWQLSAKLEDGGCGFDVYLLKEWYEWESEYMPFHYAGRRAEKDILKAYGVSDIKRT